MIFSVWQDGENIFSITPGLYSAFNQRQPVISKMIVTAVQTTLIQKLTAHV